MRVPHPCRPLLATGSEKTITANHAGLCHHVMESGFCCQSPALRDRRYCYSHLRLRGQRLRMARAIARRAALPLRRCPRLDDLVRGAGGGGSTWPALWPQACWSGARPGPCSMPCNSRPSIIASCALVPMTANRMRTRRGSHPFAKSRRQGGAPADRQACLGCPTLVPCCWGQGGRAEASGRGVSRIRGRVRTTGGTGPVAARARALPASRGRLAGTDSRSRPQDFALGPSPAREGLDQGSH